jgi:hypothetical protein
MPARSGRDESDDGIRAGQAGRARPRSAPRRRVLWHRPPAIAAAALLFAATAADLLDGRVAAATGYGAYYVLAAGLAIAALALPLGLTDAWRGLRAGALRSVTAAVHAAPIALALLLFALAFIVRAHPRIPPDPGILLMEAIATVLLGIAVMAGVRLRRAAARAPLDRTVPESTRLDHADS